MTGSDKPSSTMRFSNRVHDYVSYRPSYPSEIVGLLQKEYGISRSSIVADIGCGTGKLAQVFLEAGFFVYGVEPNREMREASEAVLAAEKNFKTSPGSAEETQLNDASVDLITVGQAFHWFDADKCRVEFRRILRPEGKIALIWNTRTSSSPFMQAYENVIHRFSRDYQELALNGNARVRHVERFFGEGNFTHHQVPYSERRTLEEVIGFCFSASYMPARESSEASEVIQELKALFEKHSSGGTVDFRYVTDVYVGPRKSG